MLQVPHIEPVPERPEPAWISARLWQLRYVKDARASTRTLRVTEAPDAAFARKKLAELSAKSHSDAKPAARAVTDAAPPSEEDMLARRLLARVLPRSLAATWLEESELDRDPVLPEGREATALRVALHEKTERVRARQGALELRERELAASECDNEGACLFSSLLCGEYSNRGPSSLGLRESNEGLSAATGDDPSVGGRLRPDEAWDTMARSRAARAAAERVLQAAAEEGMEVEVEARGGGGAGAGDEAVTGVGAGAEVGGEGGAEAGAVGAQLTEGGPAGDHARGDAGDDGGGPAGSRLSEAVALELLQRSASLRRWAAATGLGGGGGGGRDGGDGAGAGGEGDGGSEIGGCGDNGCAAAAEEPAAAAKAAAEAAAAAAAEVWTAAAWERCGREQAWRGVEGRRVGGRAAPASVRAPMAVALRTESVEGALPAAAAAAEATEAVGSTEITEGALRAVAAGATALGDPEAAQVHLV